MYWPLSQIPQCIKQISLNAPFCNRNVHLCTVLLQNDALWDMGLVHCVICEMDLLSDLSRNLAVLILLGAHWKKIMSDNKIVKLTILYFQCSYVYGGLNKMVDIYVYEMQSLYTNLYNSSPGSGNGLAMDLATSHYSNQYWLRGVISSE